MMLKNIRVYCLCVFISAGVFFGACAVMPASAQTISEFRVGEKYTYNITWLKIPVAEMIAHVKAEEMFNGRAVYVVEFSGKTNRFASTFYKVRDRFVSYIDKEKRIPLKLEVSRREGFYKKDAVTIFDHENGIAYFENFLDGSKKTYTIPEDVQDVISVFYLLRQAELETGRAVVFNVAFAETVFAICGKPQQEKVIRLPSGAEKKAFMTKPSASVSGEAYEPGTVTGYISADDYKVPLRFDLKAPLFTKITATLHKVEGVSF